MVPELHWAAIAGDLDEVQRLLNTGASVTATETLWGGERALHWGAYGGHPGVVRVLLAAGASLETRDDHGETPLREALRTDGPGYLTLQALLVAGADPKASSRGGWTALHEAVSLPSEHAPNAVRLLRMFGADPNVELEGAKITPLHLAATQPYDRFSGWALVDATIDPNGQAADVNARDNEGLTPLHWAVIGPGSAQDLQVARWLIENGADVNATDDLGLTALDWAEAFGDGAKEIADLLQKVAE
ncbi:MAG: ankyrin repeat domain-containing protein [Bryobacterales bacterium]|nr:ankyrin repeat domain-containing protein [Bryobacterales bacterium]